MTLPSSHRAGMRACPMCWVTIRDPSCVPYSFMLHQDSLVHSNVSGIISMMSQYLLDLITHRKHVYCPNLRYSFGVVISDFIFLCSCAWRNAISGLPETGDFSM